MNETNQREMPLHRGPNGKVRGHWTLTDACKTDPVVITLRQEKVMPVIFVPGIMGSNLKVKDSDMDAWNLNTTAGKPLALLAQWGRKGPARRQEILHPDRVEVKPDGAVPAPQDHYLSRGWGEVSHGSYHEYLKYLDERLDTPGGARLAATAIQQVLKDKKDATSKTPWLALRELQDITPEELKAFLDWRMPVYACGYNWLDDNKNSAQRLLTRIREVIDTNHQPNALGGAAGATCTQVLLVTHSMGGLVARACAKLPGAEELIAGVLHGVMPTNGAAVAYRRCKVGMKDEDYLASQVIGEDGREVTAVFAQAPGGLELLPTANYSKAWLEIKGPDGQFAGPALPQADPYSEIYQLKDRWWALVKEEWLRPEGSKKHITWPDFTRYLELARDFHSALSPQDYHANTIAYYGGVLQEEQRNPRSPDLGTHPSFEHVKWEAGRGRTPPGGFDQQGPGLDRVYDMGFEDLRMDGAKPEYVGGSPVTVDRNDGHGADRYESSHWELSPAKPDGTGDGTVPASSGRAPEACAKVAQVFRVAGIDHEGSYKNETVQHLTLYAIAKLLTRSKAYQAA